MKEAEITAIKSQSVSCQGNLGASAHPKVYLEVNPTLGSVTCPYCSEVFILSAVKR